MQKKYLERKNYPILKKIHLIMQNEGRDGQAVRHTGRSLKSEQNQFSTLSKTCKLANNEKWAESKFPLFSQNLQMGQLMPLLLQNIQCFWNWYQHWRQSAILNIIRDLDPFMKIE